MDDTIKKWLNDNKYNYDNSDGYVFGIDNGWGCGFCSGNGYGFSSGNGYGFNYGNGIGNGFGYGGGHMTDNGTGSGDGGTIGIDAESYNVGIKSVNGYDVHIIDDTPTIIYSIHCNVARGAIVHGTQLIPCYIYRYNGHFAHGATVRAAYKDAREKLMDSQSLEERIASFIKAYPNLDIEVPNNDLYVWHNILTGSCRLGRSEFCKIHNIDLRGKTTVRDFINIVKDSYGSNAIKELLKAYNNK